MVETRAWEARCDLRSYNCDVISILMMGVTTRNGLCRRGTEKLWLKSWDVMLTIWKDNLIETSNFLIKFSTFRIFFNSNLRKSYKIFSTTLFCSQWNSFIILNERRITTSFRGSSKQLLPGIKKFCKYINWESTYRQWKINMATFTLQ